MLDELNLLNNVQMLSTASGGTIMAIPYALSKIKEQSFVNFFDTLRLFLEEVNVVKEALDRSCKILDKNKNADISLIQIAAEIYQEKLFGREKKDFGIFLDAVHTPFKELIFNSTELNLGNSFRFRASHRPRVPIGSKSFELPKDVAKKILLGDIIAASSCFPGVFDPFIFPDDFHFDDPESIRFKDKKDKVISLPIIDGGIFDNQGVDSILMASGYDDGTKIDEGDRTDLFIISDSNPLNEDLFPVPFKKWEASLSSRTIKWFLGRTTTLGNLVERFTTGAMIGAFILCMLGIVSTIYVIIFVCQNYRLAFQSLDREIFTFIIPGLAVIAVSVLSAAAIIFLFKVKAFVKDHNEFLYEEVKFNLWVFIKKLSLGGLTRIFETRAQSALTLLTDVFLKRIRNLGTKVIMGNPAFTRLVTFNYINDMDSSVNRDKLWKKDPELKPIPEMSRISESAAKYPTNLWFDSKKHLEDVIMAGQMTVCLSILRHLWDKWEADKKEQNNPQLPRPDSVDSEFYDLYSRARAKWMEFKGDRKTIERIS
jgi:hypothetical protein